MLAANNKAMKRRRDFFEYVGHVGPHEKIGQNSLSVFSNLWVDHFAGTSGFSSNVQNGQPLGHLPCGVSQV